MTSTRCMTLATLLVLAISRFAQAQGSGQIRGRVVNAVANAPIMGATVEVMDSAAAVLSRATTDAEGQFRVPGLPPGRYRLRIIALGYRPRGIQSIEISGAIPNADVGTLALSAAPIDLPSVEVQ